MAMTRVGNWQTKWNLNKKMVETVFCTVDITVAVYASREAVGPIRTPEPPQQREEHKSDWAEVVRRRGRKDTA